MSSVKLESESRSQLMARISDQALYANKDKKERIRMAVLVFQLMKDVQTVRKASAHIVKSLIKNSNGAQGSKGTKVSKVKVSSARKSMPHGINGNVKHSILADLEECTDEGLKAIEDGCVELLAFTKQKTSFMEAERRIANEEKIEEKRKKRKAIGMAHLSEAPIPTAWTPQEDVKDMINRRRPEAMKKIKAEQDSKEKVARAKLADKKKLPPDYRGRDPHGYIFIIRNGTHHYIPPPEFDDAKVVYTLRELIDHLLPFEGMGLKRILADLSKAGRCHSSPSTFMARLKIYKETKVLPSEDDFGDIRGRHGDGEKRGKKMGEAIMSLGTETESQEHITTCTHQHRIPALEKRLKTRAIGMASIKQNTLVPIPNGVPVGDIFGTPAGVPVGDIFGAPIGAPIVAPIDVPRPTASVPADIPVVTIAAGSQIINSVAKATSQKGISSAHSKKRKIPIKSDMTTKKRTLPVRGKGHASQVENPKRSDDSPTLDYRAKIVLKKGIVHYLPPPEFDDAKINYTIRELIIHLLPFEKKGLKRVVVSLRESGRCHCSASTLLQKMSDYKKTKVLPSEGDFGDAVGRPKSRKIKLGQLIR
eukprot:CAMPEP_0194105216 /NCGR_PEP_ID=MMETSP0150-20130528/5427_1 /TAXON_ID=122233 /ORGANISM="Chaetoceros debilis, Strain MM31A-1" /LENGTH=590 /DNA_ID=CAMNT_0038792985 /DNA_START=69 /DNA_END=1841 /DNA_ORIENTATION=-